MTDCVYIHWQSVDICCVAVVDGDTVHGPLVESMLILDVHAQSHTLYFLDSRMAINVVTYAALIVIEQMQVLNHCFCSIIKQQKIHPFTMGGGG